MLYCYNCSIFCTETVLFPFSPLFPHGRTQYYNARPNVCVHTQCFIDLLVMICFSCCCFLQTHLKIFITTGNTSMSYGKIQTFLIGHRNSINTNWTTLAPVSHHDYKPLRIKGKQIVPIGLQGGAERTQHQ